MTQAINNFKHSLQEYKEMALSPVELTEGAVKTAKAYFAHDIEGIVEGVGKVSSALDLLISGTSAIIRSLIYLGMWVEKDVLTGELPKFFSMIVLPYAVIGLVLSFFELGYEIFNLYCGASMRKALKFSDKEDDLLHNQKWIRNEFFQLNPKEKEQSRIFPALERKLLHNKFQNLCRRISTPAALQLRQMINSTDLSDLKAMTKMVDLQTRKMLVMRAVGLFSVILSTLCYAFILATFPYVAFVTLGLAMASILFFLLYYALDKGLFNQLGTQFSLKACIPKLFNPDKAAAAIQNPLSSREIQLMDMRVRTSPNHH